MTHKNPERQKKDLIRWFDEVSLRDLPEVGGKNASLGEMFKELAPKGVRVPYGFCITATAYRQFLASSGCGPKIEAHLKALRANDLQSLSETGLKIRQVILEAEFPPELRDAITRAYAELSDRYGAITDVAVRSSATAEDLPTASFAGQQESFLNIRGPSQVLDACKRCFASLFTDRAISYRIDQGFDHSAVALSIGIQKMVRSDHASAGVIFTIDTESGFQNAVLITASFGLGETVVKGSVNPDEYYVFKPTLLQGHDAILMKTMGSKEIKMIYDTGGTKSTKTIPVETAERAKFTLNDDEILTLARWAIIVEDHYGRPMDIEWAKDGISGELFFVQARPETIHSQDEHKTLQIYRLKSKGPVLASGRSVGEKIGQGGARLIRDPKELSSFQKGEVLITEMTDPDWEPIMRMAAAIVTNSGSRTCHAAIVARELGIPAVVGAVNATERIPTGMPVTVSCAEGEEGRVYEGRLQFDVEKVALDHVPRTRTKILVNIGSPQEAFSTSFLPVDGVGLAREEFIVSSHVKIHPKALIQFDHPESEKKIDANARLRIETLTRGYSDKTRFFIDKLAEGIAMISAAFWPRDVILRFSDFKTNEYANLIGGSGFEPNEDNPMLGWRGAARYYSDYADGFALECAAIRKVRDRIGLKNLKLMVPMVRTLSEADKVLAELKKNGLESGKDGLEIYMMCEVPSNALLAEQFLEKFDGYSIGSNDLTQFTLAVDRDSPLVADIYDERDEAVKTLIRNTIDAAKRKGKKIGICGQAPSDKPDFAEFLVDCGIDSISLNSDSVLKTLLLVATKERGEKRWSDSASAVASTSPQKTQEIIRT